MILNKIISFLLIGVLSRKCLGVPLIDGIQTQNKRNGNIPIVPLHRINESFYVTNITIGTPPQLFTVAFTNQIPLTTISSVNCDTCEGIHFYNHSKSSTSNVTNILEKNQIPNPQKSTIEGLRVYDTLNLAGLDVTNQVFYEAEYEINCTFPMDGVISLVFLTQFKTNSIIFNMYSQGLIDNPLVGYYISSDSGEVSFGEPNPDHYIGNLSYFPIDIESVYQWKIPLNNYSINNEIISSNFTDKFDYWVQFDMSVENIQVGSLTMKQINDAIGADLQLDGSYTLDCDTLDQYPSFSFIFGGQSFTLEPQDYTYVKDNQCVSYFVTNPGFKDDYFRFITGQPFFKKFYTVFDFGNAQIGFADAK